jgi:hypothetical protein
VSVYGGSGMAACQRVRPWTGHRRAVRAMDDNLTNVKSCCRRRVCEGRTWRDWSVERGAWTSECVILLWV